MSLRISSPDIVKQLRTNAAEMLRRILAERSEHFESLQKIYKTSTPEQWTDERYPGLIDNYGMSVFKDILLDRRIGKRIVQMSWLVWNVSKKHHRLILADQPCIFSHGIDNPRLIIALLISPTKVFMPSGSDATDMTIKRQNGAKVALRVNDLTVSQAKIRIYAEYTSPQRFIMNRSRRLGRQPISRLRGMS